MAKKKDKEQRRRPRPEGDKPAGDTLPNEGVDGGPPPTWDPGKTTQPQPQPEEE